jgi:hypothetical protein
VTHATAPLTNVTKSRRLISDHLAGSNTESPVEAQRYSVDTEPSVKNFTDPEWRLAEGGAYLFCRIYTLHIGPLAQLLMPAPGTKLTLRLTLDPRGDKASPMPRGTSATEGAWQNRGSPPRSKDETGSRQLVQ